MKKIHIVILALFTILCIFNIYISGTGDDGDSINHYLFALWAPRHPRLYFHHWAKPVFVLLASAFAWMGFKGVVLFNICVITLSAYFTAKVSEKIWPGSWLYTLALFICAPLHFILIFSGLTEPLFGLFLILGVYLAYNAKSYNLSAIFLSFLPLVRSEGLFILCIFALLFFYLKQYKAIFLLAFGNLLYAIAGWLYGLHFLWIITDIPYSSGPSSYGRGPLLHFVIQMFYVVGLPIYIFLCIGLLYVAFTQIRKKALLPEGYILPLVITIFAAYFTAHSLSWYLGIFNSFGMKRVLVGIAPLTAILSMAGIHFISGLAAERFRAPLKLCLISIVVIFPFLNTPSSILKADISPTASQHLADSTKLYLEKENLVKGNKYYYNYPYLSYVLNKDPFDSLQSSYLGHAVIQKLKPGNIIIWDSWYSPVEGGMALDDLDKLKNLEKLKEFFTQGDGKNRIVIFKVKENY